MFNINYIELFKNIPPQIAAMLIAMFPIAELRVSIPIALGVYKLSTLSSFFWSVLGNFIPAVIILKFIEPISNWLSEKSNLMKKFFSWLFERTKGKFKGDYMKYGELALVVFIAIPFPLTGAWTGSIAAFLFGIPPKRAAWLVFLGIVGAGVIVTCAAKFGFFSYKLLK